MTNLKTFLWMFFKKQCQKTHSQKFRVGVGAIIVNQNGLVFAGMRKDRANVWQLPQGGVIIGESPKIAVYREIEEETGIKPESLKLIAQNDTLLAYELPPALRSKIVRGQVHYWFIFRFTATDDKITLGDQKEFINWKWMTMDEIVGQIVPFKRCVYQQLLDFYRKNVKN